MATRLNAHQATSVHVSRAADILEEEGLSLEMAFSKFGLPGDSYFDGESIWTSDSNQLDADVWEFAGVSNEPIDLWRQFCFNLAVDASRHKNQLDSWRLRNSLRWGIPTVVDWAAQSLNRWSSESLVEPCESDGVYNQSDVERAIDSSAAELSLDPRTDIPSRKLAQNRARVEAGISGVRARIVVQDQIYDAYDADIDALIELPVINRGAHMSRIQSAIVSASEVTFNSLLDAAVWIAGSVASTQDNEQVTISASQLAIVDTVSPKTAINSNFSIRVIAKVTFRTDHALQGSIAAVVPIMTACPCTLAYSRLLATEIAGQEIGRNLPPGFTHSQPGELKLMAQGVLADLPTLEDLVGIALGAAHVRTSVLKRPDEHEFVRKVHERPQFAEDVVRLAASDLACRLHGDVLITAGANLSESIHPHQASANVRAPARELWVGGQNLE